MVLVFFDLETSGLDPTRHRITQLAAATEAGVAFEVKVRFQESLAEPGALRLGWYDRGAWDREAVDLATALDRFDAWFASVEPVPWNRKLAGHFAAEFDKPFLLAAYKSLGRRFPADFRIQDTMQLALWLLPGRRSYKLGDLCRDLCGIEVRKADGAPGDVRATIALVRELRKRFGRGAGGKAPPAPLEPQRETPKNLADLFEEFHGTPGEEPSKPPPETRATLAAAADEFDGRREFHDAIEE